MFRRLPEQTKCAPIWKIQKIVGVSEDFSSLEIYRKSHLANRKASD